MTTGEYVFPDTLEGEPFFESPDPYYEGPIPRVAPANPLPVFAGAAPSVYRLHRVDDHMQMVELTGSGDPAYFSYDPPPGHVPQGLMQWYVRHPGDSKFTVFGGQFRYRTEANSFWERTGK